MSPFSTSPSAYKRINRSKLYYVGFKETLSNVREVSESESCSVVSNSLQPYGLYSPGNSPSQNPGVGSLSLLQGIFPTQRSNPGLLHCRQILYSLRPPGKPKNTRLVSLSLLQWIFLTLSMLQSNVTLQFLQKRRAIYFPIP